MRSESGRSELLQYNRLRRHRIYSRSMTHPGRAALLRGGDRVVPTLMEGVTARKAPKS
jgi:hypothetical protein